MRQREIYDPILTFQLSNGFHVKKVLRDYLAGDTESMEFATLLEWNNIYYEEKPKLLSTRKKEVRLGVVQWQNAPGYAPRDHSRSGRIFCRYGERTMSRTLSSFRSSSMHPCL